MKTVCKKLCFSFDYVALLVFTLIFFCNSVADSFILKLDIPKLEYY